MPLVMCLDGEGDGMEETDTGDINNDSFGVALWGQFGDWENCKWVGRGKDFTQPIRYGDGQSNYSLPHWELGKHRG